MTRLCNNVIAACCNRTDGQDFNKVDLVKIVSSRARIRRVRDAEMEKVSNQQSVLNPSPLRNANGRGRPARLSVALYISSYLPIWYKAATENTLWRFAPEPRAVGSNGVERGRARSWKKAASGKARRGLGGVVWSLRCGWPLRSLEESNIFRASWSD